MKKLKLGDSELETLRFVARNRECTVRDASDHFASSRGWGRTTVLKTLDRLREKGLLEREEVEGIFRYRTTMTEAEIQESLVHQFLDRSMEGSLKSFVSYLGTYPDLSNEDIKDLKELVRKLEEKG